MRQCSLVWSLEHFFKYKFLFHNIFTLWFICEGMGHCTLIVIMKKIYIVKNSNVYLNFLKLLLLFYKLVSQHIASFLSLTSLQCFCTAKFFISSPFAFIFTFFVIIPVWDKRSYAQKRIDKIFTTLEIIFQDGFAILNSTCILITWIDLFQVHYGTDNHNKLISWTFFSLITAA